MENTFNRNAALRTGAIAGLIIGLVSGIPSLLLDARSIVALSTPITALSCILTLVGGLLIGYLGARSSGANQDTRVRAGLFAGLAGGVVIGIISLIFTQIQLAQGVTAQIFELTFQQQLASVPESQRAATRAALEQTRGMTETITRFASFASPLISGVIMMALGALGGLFLRKSE